MVIKTLGFSSHTLTLQPVCTALVSSNAAALAQGLLPMQRTGLRVEINLSSVGDLDGAGLGALLSCRHAMQRVGCEMLVTHVQPHIAQDLKTCGLEVLMKPTVDNGVLSQLVP